MPVAAQTGITFENGVANGVVYLNASKTTTQSGGLTYNGSLLTIIGAAGVRTQAAATQDAIALAGRAGGTGSFVTTLTPGTMTASVTHTLPIVSGTLATTANTAQTFAGSVTINGSLTVGGNTVNHNIGNALTTGSVTVGSTTQTGNINLGQSTGAQTLNLHTGATTSGTTKTLNLGTGGASGSTTNINIGSSTSGATNTIVANGRMGVGIAPTSTLHANGSFATSAPVLVAVATYTVAATDYAIVLTGSNTTLTLPTPSSFVGRILCLSNQGAFSATSASANVVLMGSGQMPASRILPGISGKCTIIQSNGTNWIEIANNLQGADALIIVSAATTLQANRRYGLNSSAGAFNLTLPAGMAEGDWVDLIDVGGALATNNVTVLRGSYSAIRALAEDLILDVPWDSVRLINTATGIFES